MPFKKSDVIEKKSDMLNEYIKEINISICNILKNYICYEKLEKIISDSLNSSGKMIRSKLLISISTMENKKVDQKIIQQCSIIEITHLASLLHDDIIDDSLLRRGYPSIQSKYGKDVAVFAGDYMISRVFNHLLKNELHNEALIISNTISDMCNGEVGQNLLKYNENIDEDKYFQNISNKTASFFKAACQIGAINASLDKEMTYDIMKFGENLGIMFQLRDDLVDIISTKEEMGKEVFKDFREGIYTYPVIMGLKDKKHGKQILSYIRLNKKRPLNVEEIECFKECLLSSKSDILTIKKICELKDENENILAKSFKNNIASKKLKKILYKVSNI